MRRWLFRPITRDEKKPQVVHRSHSLTGASVVAENQKTFGYDTQESTEQCLGCSSQFGSVFFERFSTKQRKF